MREKKYFKVKESGPHPLDAAEELDAESAARYLTLSKESLGTRPSTAATTSTNTSSQQTQQEQSRRGRGGSGVSSSGGSSLEKRRLRFYSTFFTITTRRLTKKQPRSIFYYSWVRRLIVFSAHPQTVFLGLQDPSVSNADSMERNWLILQVKNPSDVDPICDWIEAHIQHKSTEHSDKLPGTREEDGGGTGVRDLRVRRDSGSIPYGGPPVLLAHATDEGVEPEPNQSHYQRIEPSIAGCETTEAPVAATAPLLLSKPERGGGGVIDAGSEMDIYASPHSHDPTTLTTVLYNERGGEGGVGLRSRVVDRCSGAETVMLQRAGPHSSGASPASTLAPQPPPPPPSTKHVSPLTRVVDLLRNVPKTRSVGGEVTRDVQHDGLGASASRGWVGADCGYSLAETSLGEEEEGEAALTVATAKSTCASAAHGPKHVLYASDAAEKILPQPQPEQAPSALDSATGKLESMKLHHSHHAWGKLADADSGMHTALSQAEDEDKPVVAKATGATNKHLPYARPPRLAEAILSTDEAGPAAHNSEGGGDVGGLRLSCGSPTTESSEASLLAAVSENRWFYGNEIDAADMVFESKRFVEIDSKTGLCREVDHGPIFLYCAQFRRPSFQLLLQNKGAGHSHFMSLPRDSKTFPNGILTKSSTLPGCNSATYGSYGNGVDDQTSETLRDYKCLLSESASHADTGYPKMKLNTIDTMHSFVSTAQEEFNKTDHISIGTDPLLLEQNKFDQCTKDLQHAF